MAPEVCPNCGADVPPNAKACPECGSDEQTGWSAEANLNGADIPEENFDYDRFVKSEFGGQGEAPRGMRWFWWLIALVLLSAFLLIWLK
jgi:hypothetical protein